MTAEQATKLALGPDPRNQLYPAIAGLAFETSDVGFRHQRSMRCGAPVFQCSCEGVGCPDVRRGVAIMKLSGDWHDLEAKLDKPHPRYGKPTQLSIEFAEEEEADTGKGL